MSQGRLSLVRKFRLSPEKATELTEKAEKMNMTESEYLRFMILQKPKDYPEMKIFLIRKYFLFHGEGLLIEWDVIHTLERSK